MAIPDLLVPYGLAVLFAWAFAVQAGVPAPAIPMLVGAGALSGSSLGRFLRARGLAALCRFSMDRDHLVRCAKNRFTAHRGRYLVLAKFLPGVNSLATSPPTDAQLGGQLHDARLRRQRHVSALEATSGALAFGWSTAVIVAVVIRQARFRHRLQFRQGGPPMRPDLDGLPPQHEAMP